MVLQNRQHQSTIPSCQYIRYRLQGSSNSSCCRHGSSSTKVSPHFLKAFNGIGDRSTIVKTGVETSVNTKIPNRILSGMNKFRTNLLDGHQFLSQLSIKNILDSANMFCFLQKLSCKSPIFQSNGKANSICLIRRRPGTRKKWHCLHTRRRAKSKIAQSSHHMTSIPHNIFNYIILPTIIAQSGYSLYTLRSRPCCIKIPRMDIRRA
mmetsp:Transcript_21688/g.39127  ORF Transcript_21688/g.39127 Transcript_21688/m.39127 type:complete len:207 (-) Transcript_21688:372-992(-)